MNKVALITGGSRGIGAATALLAASQGWTVAINYLRHAHAAEAIAQKIRDAGGVARSAGGLQCHRVPLFLQAARGRREKFRIAPQPAGIRIVDEEGVPVDGDNVIDPLLPAIIKRS